MGEAETGWDKFKILCSENKLAAASAVIILVIALMAIFAPVVAPYDPTKQDLLHRLEGMSAAHIFGTDQLGRDVFSRMIYGARVSLVIGLLPTFLSLALGTVLGLISGYLGKAADFVIMRLADITMAFPSLLLAMVVMYTLGAGIVNIFLALTFVSWAGTARVIRSQTLSLREMEYIEAARSMGVSKWRIMFQHILPNCLPNLIVLFTLNIPGSILSESSLSFLGIGAQPPMTSWGLMVSDGKQYLFTDPVVAIAPGVAILILALAFNFLGDGVRDVLDPYLNKQ
ncbi:MAG: ABC transporter permease [Lachnospiraceae bacterium]|nr:ABC transporter permease [Lachnospiraceae bacterium]MCI1397818.1 ABC transporter permease [Lachnospiraceae bacterium]MCI1424712.1 ABC transporter permease [Lachnospiraceae bacterium]MCI1453163.1 ABC transporter permease [Lachnospiraceae bacterium]MDD5850428.1 ABC transporter permease [Bacillota bacterium]